MTSTIQAPSRHGRAILALLVALPLALAVHAGETALAWWQAKSLFPTSVRWGETVEYAGARWRLDKLSTVATKPDGSAIVLAEIDATVTDRETFVQLPCSIALSGPDLPNWLPVFIAPSEVTKARPDVVERPTCGTAKIGDVQPGKTIKMAETFQIPWHAFERVHLELSLPPERPRYLVFER